MRSRTTTVAPPQDGAAPPFVRRQAASGSLLLGRLGRGLTELGGRDSHRCGSVGRLRVNCLGLLGPVCGDGQRHREDRRLLARLGLRLHLAQRRQGGSGAGDQLGVGPCRVPHAHAAVLSNRGSTARLPGDAVC